MKLEIDPVENGYIVTTHDITGIERRVCTRMTEVIELVWLRLKRQARHPVKIMPEDMQALANEVA